MVNPLRIWQVISLALTAALVVTLVKLHHAQTATRPLKSTLPTVNKTSQFAHLTLSPNARRALERYRL